MLFRLHFAQCLLIGVASALLPCTGQAAERAGIYLLLADDSAIHLTDRPQGLSRPLVSETTTPLPVSSPAPSRSTAAAVDDFVRQAADANTLDPNLLHAVIATESGYRNTAVSRRGAQGLMQLMPSTARSLGVTDPFDARQNISAGARHLRGLLDTFGQDTLLALAAYNAGAAAVVRHGRRIPPFAETTAYVPRVLGRLAALQIASATPP